MTGSRPVARSAGGRSGLRAVWADRDTRVYLAGQTLSIFGDTTLWLGVALWVKLLTHSSSDAGLVFFVYTLPSVAAPAGGVLVDRVRRRPLLIVLNLLSAPTVLLLLAVTGRHQLWLIYVVMFLYGISGSLLASAQSAFLTVLVPARLLPDANAVLQTGREALRLVSPLIGAAVVATVGSAKPVAIFDAATFVVASGSLAVLRVREPRPARPEGRRTVELLAGIRHLWHTPPLRQIVVAGAVALLVIGFDETLVFAAVQHGLHRPATFVGILVSVQGVGAIGGGLTAARSIRRLGEGHALAIGLTLFGLGDATLMAGNLPLAVGGIVVAGFGLPWAVVALSVAVQRRTPAHLQGRAASAADALLSTPQTVSIGLGAALVLVVDYRILLAVVAVVVLVACAWLATRREQRVLGGAGEHASPAEGRSATRV